MNHALISYADLARLRLKDFLGSDAQVWVEESGMHVVVGLGGFERFGETAFGWKQGERYQTAEVTLDLSSTSILPESLAKEVIETLKLPVRKGMTASELIHVFGEPEIDEQATSRRFLRFVCGAEEPYVLGCGVDAKEGLVHLFLARKDYCDEDELI